MRVRSGMLLFFVSTGACSALTSLDGFSSDPTSSSVPDASGLDGSSSTDGGSDAIPDRSASDGALTNDASTPFCASLLPSPSFCDDFDSSEPAFTGWEDDTSGSGSVIEPITALFRSAPRAIRATVGPPPGNRGAFLRKPFPPVVTHARLGYAVYIDERPAAGDIEVNILRFMSNTTFADFYLSIFDGGASYAQQEVINGNPTSTNIPLSRPIPLKTWTRITLEVDASAAKLVVVTIDGIEAARTAAIYAKPGTPLITAGITYAGPAANKGTVLIDDITFDILK